MINVREGTFETNSSSAHNIVVVEDSQFEKWKEGKIFFIEHDNKFISEYERERILEEDMGRMVMEYSEDSQFRNAIAEAVKENRLKEYIQERIDNEDWHYDFWDRPLSFTEWQNIWRNRELEEESMTYTTPKGEKIHIFCQYGYDG